jgi:hypothetical protein
MLFSLGCTHWFSVQNMPWRQNHNLICHGLGPSSTGFGTNLKLLTNSNARFHWTLLLGPLSKVALNYIYRRKISLLQEPSIPTPHDLRMFIFVIILTLNPKLRHGALCFTIGKAHQWEHVPKMWG